MTQHVSRLPVRVLTPEQLQRELARYEQQHRLTSQAFYARFTRGEPGDQLDWFTWAGLCEMAIAYGLFPAQPVEA